MSDAAIAVLLVEDNQADAALFRELLQDSDAESWHITHAKRLGQALEHLRTDGFDVVLLDLSLPDSQGLNTITQVQSAVPLLPIVVLTGLQDKAIAHQAMAQGAQDYLIKGQLTPELLLKTVSYSIERAHILKRLQESEHRFRGVFDQTFQFMSLLSPTGVVLDINQITRVVSGFQVEAVINALIWDAPCWKRIAQSQDWLKEAVLKASQGETMRAELQAHASSGTLWWLDVSIKPLKDEHGGIPLLIAEGRDISKLKQAEAESCKALEKERELNQMKNSFISMVSHEFRNPISAISFAVDMLEECELTVPQKEKLFTRIRNSITDTLNLLDEILLLGRTEAGRVEVDYKLLDLACFCCEIVESIQLTLGKSHQIYFSMAGDSAHANMDTSLLKHILDNLLSNAVKYSPEGGTIHFKLTCQDDQVKFCIQDQGIGIPLECQSRLFEAFYRAKNVSKIHGTGLGLAIVKRCVDLHQGQIYVESQEGVGTTFNVVIPRNLHSRLSSSEH